MCTKMTGHRMFVHFQGPSSNPGLNQRALKLLFEETRDRGIDWHFSINVSVIEIYNEMIRDLLGDNPSAKLEVKQGKEGLYVPGLTEIQVKDVHELNEVWDIQTWLLLSFHRLLKALANEDTYLRTHYCLWCFLGCANWETFVADTKCFWTKTQNCLCPQQMLRARANGETFVSATMCPRLPRPLRLRAVLIQYSQRFWREQRENKANRKPCHVIACFSRSFLAYFNRRRVEERFSHVSFLQHGFFRYGLESEQML